MDYKNDYFTNFSTSYPTAKDPAREVTSDIAQYIRWMEHEYHHGSTSRLEKSPRDDWYFRRISSLRRLVNALEISMAEIVDRTRNMWMPESERLSFNVEESIKHFQESLI